MKAAAKGYFGKALEELTLAQYAILAAIPQSPTKFDLVKNAEEVCLDDPPPRRRHARATARRARMVVPHDSEIVAAPQLHPRPDEDPQRADRRKHTPGRVRGRQARAGRHQAAGLRDLAGAPIRVAGP